MAMISERWTRVRTLGRGASGAQVFLAADDASGELFAVKSARASGAAALRREQAIMSGLRSPRVVSCIGGSAGRDGSYQLFLEFAPGGSIAEEIAKAGGLDERAIRAYAADIVTGLGIKALACPASAVPDWDSDEGWMDVLSAPTEASDAVAVPTEETTDLEDAISSEEQAADCGVLHVTMDSSVLNVVEEPNYDSELHSRHQSSLQ